MDESTQKQINDYIKSVSDKEVKETIERSTELIRQKICTEVGLAIKENRTLITNKYIELVQNNIDIDKILTTEILNHLNRFILSLKTSPDEVIKKIMETQSSIGTDEELKNKVDESDENKETEKGSDEEFKKIEKKIEVMMKNLKKKYDEIDKNKETEKGTDEDNGEQVEHSTSSNKGEEDKKVGGKKINKYTRKKK